VSDLHGKVALVTGAGGMKGVGRAVALTLAAKGADVVISDVHRPQQELPPQEVKAGWKSIDSVAAEIEALGRRVLTVWCDLSKSAEIENMIAQTVSHFARLDILVNNARAIIGRDQVPVTELDDEVWRHFFAINTTAPFLTTKHAARVMIRQGGGGRIVNIASDSGKRTGKARAAYCASKFAVIGLTQCSALDLAPYRITVNSVCPGFINSDRFNYREADEAQKRGVPLEEYRATLVASAIQEIPLGRAVESDEIASLVGFLASEEASMITGQSYSINGGTVIT
jgi:NAD(P)-dependent dehydrogenase (short-subunit alcohol dehydrogenase family)